MLAAALMAPGVSMAVPVEWVFTTTISPTPTIPGVATGDTFVLSVIVDNGGSDLVSQIWLDTEVVTATAVVGTYSATYNPPVLNQTFFQTNTLGNISSAGFFDTDTNNEDGGGASSLVKIFSNAFNDSSGGFALFAQPTNNDPNWTVALAPEPSTPSLSALGMLGLASLGAMRRRAQPSPQLPTR